MTDEELNEHPRPCFHAHRILGGSNFTYIFQFKPKIGYESNPFGSFTTITIAEHYDSLEVGVKYYKDVIRMHETNNYTENGKETNFYIARHYGIIRFDINDKEDSKDPDNWQRWDLVRANIIPSSE